jgi:hypothetical protein
MTELITIVANDKSKKIAEYLNDLINSSGTYQSIIKTKIEHESASFEEELLGKSNRGPTIFINIDSKSTYAAYNDKMSEEIDKKIKWNIAPDSLVKKMEWRYNKFGMKYGWYQKDALLSVKKITPNMENFDPLIAELSEKIDEIPILPASSHDELVAIHSTALTKKSKDWYLIWQDDKIFTSKQIFLVTKFCKSALAKFMEQDA